MKKPYLTTLMDSLGAQACRQWGMRAQAIKACEELAELIVQLTKRLNGSPTTNEAIIDEIADATIMVRQMRHLFGVDKVDERISHKLTKLNIALSRMEETGEARITDTILEENAYVR